MPCLCSQSDAQHPAAGTCQRRAQQVKLTVQRRVCGASGSGSPASSQRWQSRYSFHLPPSAITFFPSGDLMCPDTCRHACRLRCAVLLPMPGACSRKRVECMQAQRVSAIVQRLTLLQLYHSRHGNRGD